MCFITIFFFYLFTSYHVGKIVWSHTSYCRSLYRKKKWSIIYLIVPCYKAIPTIIHLPAVSTTSFRLIATYNGVCTTRTNVSVNKAVTATLYFEHRSCEALSESVVFDGITKVVDVQVVVVGHGKSDSEIKVSEWLLLSAASVILQPLQIETAQSYATLNFIENRLPFLKKHVNNKKFTDCWFNH